MNPQEDFTELNKILNSKSLKKEEKQLEFDFKIETSDEEEKIEVGIKTKL